MGLEAARFGPGLGVGGAGKEPRLQIPGCSSVRKRPELSGAADSGCLCLPKEDSKGKSLLMATPRLAMYVSCTLQLFSQASWTASRATCRLGNGQTIGYLYFYPFLGCIDHESTNT